MVSYKVLLALKLVFVAKSGVLCTHLHMSLCHQMAALVWQGLLDVVASLAEASLYTYPGHVDTQIEPLYKARAILTSVLPTWHEAMRQQAFQAHGTMVHLVCRLSIKLCAFEGCNLPSSQVVRSCLRFVANSLSMKRCRDLECLRKIHTKPRNENLSTSEVESTRYGADLPLCALPSCACTSTADNETSSIAAALYTRDSSQAQPSI